MERDARTDVTQAGGAQGTTAPTHGSQPSGTRALVAAGTLAVERALGMDPASQLHHLVERVDGRALSGQQIVAGIETVLEQHGLRKPTPAKAPDYTAASKAFVELQAWLQKQSRADLTLAVRDLALTNQDFDTLAYALAPLPSQVRGHAYLAMTPAQRAALNPTETAIALTPFDWITAEEDWELLRAAMLALPASGRAMLFTAQNAAVQAELERRGVDATVTDADTRAMTPDDDWRVFNAFTSGGAMSVDPFPAWQARWATAPKPLQDHMLSWQAGMTPPDGFYSLAVALLASPAQRAPYLERLVLNMTRRPADLAVCTPDLVPGLVALRRELSVPLREQLDAALLAGNAQIAAATGAVATPGLQLPGPRPPAFRPVTGAAVAPPIHDDHGYLDDGKGNIDPSKRREATLGDRAEKLEWEAIAIGAEKLRPDLQDAVRAYRHFLDASGSDLEFSYDKYVNDDPSGAATLRSAMKDVSDAAVAMNDAHQQKAEHFEIQTGGIPVGSAGYDGGEPYPYPKTENWKKAIGAHTIWLDANVTVSVSGGQRSFVVDLTLHAEDRFNFNPGAEDIATSPYSQNGRFEVTGLAKEFMSRATLKRQFAFVAPVRSPVPIAKHDDRIAKPPPKKPT